MCHRTRSQVLRFWEAKQFLVGQDFCFYYIFKTNFSEHNNIWEVTKMWEGTASECFLCTMHALNMW